jgi:unsaturated rhamnogalacturonyl hydrolase
VFLAGAEMIALLRSQSDVITSDGGVQFGKSIP